MSTHNLCFVQKYENIRFFVLSEYLPFCFGCKIFNMFEWHVFIMNFVASKLYYCIYHKYMSLLTCLPY